jgi:hypothetical protein
MPDCTLTYRRDTRNRIEIILADRDYPNSAAKEIFPLPPEFSAVSQHPKPIDRQSVRSLR